MDATALKHPAPPADPPWMPTIAEEVAWDRRWFDRDDDTETDPDD